MDTALPNDDCGGSDLTADGVLAATAIILAANDLSKQACGDAGSAGATGQLVEIGIATTEYAGNQTMTHTQALAPGMYTVGNQMVPDEDFCMIPTGDTAWFQVLTFDDAGVPFASWNGVSGTVTVASIDNTSVAGSFNVQLGDANGEQALAGSLSGTFSAATCGH